MWTSKDRSVSISGVATEAMAVRLGSAVLLVSTLLRLRCWKRGFVKNVWDPLGLTTPDNLAPAPTGANRLVNTDPPDLYSQGGQGTYGGQGGGYGHVLLVPLLAATERSLLNLCHIHRRKSTLARSITITTIPPVMTKRVATSTSGSCYF